MKRKFLVVLFSSLLFMSGAITGLITAFYYYDLEVNNQKKEDFSMHIIHSAFVGKLASEGNSIAIISNTKEILEKNVCNDPANTELLPDWGKHRMAVDHNIKQFYETIDQPLPVEVKNWLGKASSEVK